MQPEVGGPVRAAFRTISIRTSCNHLLGISVQNQLAISKNKLGENSVSGQW